MQRVFDNMMPVRDSYMPGEHLPNAMLVSYPDAGYALAVSVSQPICKAALFLDSKVID